MKHEFSDTLRADPERFALAQKAAKQLDEITANTRFRARAIWDRGLIHPSLKMKVEPLLSLTILDDESHSVQGDVWPNPVAVGTGQPDEQVSIHRLAFQVAQIWGAYLQSLSTALFESANESSGVAVL